MRRPTLLIPAVLAAFACAAPAAQAYDTQPHTDMTRDALSAEGFNQNAGDITAFTNWFADFYSQASHNPHSGHADALTRIIAGAVFTENWPQRWLDAAEKTHFDSVTTQDPNAEQKVLSTTLGVEREWERLMRNTAAGLQQARQRQDAHQLLAVMGTSLHTVQDFYAHSNWVEPANTPGFDGPGWKQRGYGDFPTWFDVPKGERDGSRIEMANAPGGHRKHGGWKDDHNESLTTSENKDTPGRPMYEQAYITSHFASRQWVQAMKVWLGDDALWSRAQRIGTTPALGRDRNAALEISLYTGRWAGGGGPCVPTHDGGGAFSCGPIVGPAGSLVNLRQAINGYFDQGPSVYRRAFQDTIEHFGRDFTPGEPAPNLPLPAPSRDVQAQTQFTKLQVTKQEGIDLGDPASDDADLFVRAGIAGQEYQSTVIHDHDSFSFPRPHHPHTFLKAVPVGARFKQPVTDIRVRIKTGDVRYAGTNDDVTVVLGNGLRFSLEKRAYDDFERGDNDTYAIPLDRLTLQGGVTLSDITRFQIVKSRDGAGGGWRLGGAELIVNGRTLVRNDAINRWLEDDQRTFSATFPRDHRTAAAMPVWLRLMEDDLVYGGDDAGDINPVDRNTLAHRAYTPGTSFATTATGGDRLSGRLAMDNGEKGRIGYRLSTVRGTPPPAAPTPTPNPSPVKPDLVITAMDSREVTVTNQGDALSGAFSVTVNGYTPVRFGAGLPVGASETKRFNFSGDCGGVYRATADALNEVAETNEANNTRATENIVC